MFKSAIKSTIRTLWKSFFRPIFKLLPESRLKGRLMRAGYKIEKRQWWGYVPLATSDPFLLKELRALCIIEHGLSPTKHFLHEISTNVYAPSVNLEHHSVGSSYGLIARALGTFDFDVVFLAPWLKRGGADLGLLHHIQTQVDKGYRVLLITTLKADSPWVSKLPRTVHYLNLAELTEKLSESKKVEVLARVLLQTKAQVIHNINSDLGWQVFKYYGHQLTFVNKKLFASVFCEDISKSGISYGFAPSYLSNTYKFLSGVFCDTQWYPNTLMELTGLDKSLLKTIYFPYEGEVLLSATSQTDAPILWASRFVDQKRPDLLLAIAKKMSRQVFHIYGECDTHHQHILRELKKLPNVKYFGAYDSFAQLCSNKQYSLFLYTSAYDGLPNVLLEAIANGLPIVASDVGGIRELLAEDVLMSADASDQEYVSKIEWLLQDADALKRSWQHAHSVIKTRHQWSNFVSELEKIDGYFPIEDRGVFFDRSQNVRVLTQTYDLNTMA